MSKAEPRDVPQMAVHMTAGKHGGFTYLIMLLALTIFSVGLAALGLTWSAVAQRDQEKELIQIGQIYQDAIADYYNRSPGQVKKYPATWQDLLQDSRYVGTVRHVRRIYIDPLTRSPTWGLIPAPDGGFMGVVSLSTKETLSQQPRRLDNGSVIAGTHYNDWKFIVQGK